MPSLPEFLNDLAGGAAIDPLQVAGRLVLALVLGGVVALIYRTSRPAEETGHSFTATLVLLTILIALVTQVIGDSVARAFSLVGALSIVRFRTVVRDTQDTAYVIFSVVVGMAIGASDPWVAVIGIVVVAVAAGLLRASAGPVALALSYRLRVRVSAGRDPKTLLGATLDQYVASRRMVSISAVRQGTVLEVIYRTAAPDEQAAAALVRALTAIEGVFGVEFERWEMDED